jgi:hypothetical protein
MAPIPDEVLRGRRFLISAIFFILFADGITIVAKMPQSGFQTFAVGVLRWLIAAGLLFAMWRGHRWARWLMVVLLIFGLASFLPSALQSPNPLFIGVMVQFAWALVLLSVPASVSAFQAFQRAQKKA